MKTHEARARTGKQIIESKAVRVCKKSITFVLSKAVLVLSELLRNGFQERVLKNTFCCGCSTISSGRKRSGWINVQRDSSKVSFGCQNSSECLQLWAVLPSLGNMLLK